MVNRKSLIILMAIMGILYIAALLIICFIFLYVAPMRNPPFQFTPIWDLITDGVKIIIPFMSIMIWLYFWNLLIGTFFWRTLKSNGEEEENEEKPEE